MSQTKTGDIFKEIGGMGSFVGEKVGKDGAIGTNVRQNLFQCRICEVM
jgi:hypothetical protein